MYRERFSTSTGPTDFPGALVQLTHPKQIFLEHVDYPNHAAVHRRMLPAYNPALNSFSIAPGTNPDQEIAVTISATDVGTLFVLLSKTQTSPPTVELMIASGVAIPGSTINYTFTGQDRGATYYGWAIACCVRLAIYRADRSSWRLSFAG
jgi:hypothetical protein